ncbi:MAG: hypothetical protein ACXVAS_11340 [Vulcanimicrobiaceae bacterium]
MPNLKQVEEQIFAREGFRVRLTPLDEKAKPKSLPAYDYGYMASNKWKLSEWQMVRLARYIPFARSIEVYRGDGQRVKSDMRLGNLRDTYFDAFCQEEVATLQPPEDARDNVVPMRKPARARKK